MYRCSYKWSFGVLIWARQNGCPWDMWTCNYAAENGHLDVLKWAHQNGCPQDALIITLAALRGHLHIFQWARDNDCPYIYSNASMSVAVNGKLNILKWARQNNFLWDDANIVHIRQTHEERHEITEWLRTL